MLHLRIIALIASFFSFLFSLSIVFELKRQIIKLQGYYDHRTFYAMLAFAAFFLFVNELYKVKSLARAFYVNRKKPSFLTCLTFSISIILSSIGITFWIDKTGEQENAQVESVQSERMLIKEKYTFIIDSVSQLNNNSLEYERVTQDINFWKNRSCKTDELREQARNEIAKLESHQRDLQTDFKASLDRKILRYKELQDEEIKQLEIKNENFRKLLNENKFIFYILFAMVIFVEIAIVYIQYDLSKIYTPEQKMHIKVLKSLLMKETGNITTLVLKHNRDFNPSFKEDDDFKARDKSFRYLLGDLGVITKGKDEGGKILNQKTGVKVLKNYYRKTNSVIN